MVVVGGGGHNGGERGAEAKGETIFFSEGFCGALSQINVLKDVW